MPCRPGVASASRKRPISRPSRENATSCSSRSAAAPDATASRASSRPSAKIVRATAGGDRRGGVQEDRVALGAVLSGEHAPDRLCILDRIAASQRRRARSGVDRAPRGRPSAPSHPRPRPRRRGSARPARARRRRPRRARRTPASAPSMAITLATVRGELRRVDAHDLSTARPAGFVSGPMRLKIVRVPSSRRTGAACRIAG